MDIVVGVIVIVIVFLLVRDFLASTAARSMLMEEVEIDTAT